MYQTTMLTIKGESMSAKEWSRRPGAVSYGTILYRVRHGLTGWPAVYGPAWASCTEEPARPVRKREAGKPWLVRSQFSSFRSYPISMLDVLRKVS
jgi:hypothetical protein